MSTGAWVAVAAAVLAVAFGLWRRRTDGRFAPLVVEPVETPSQVVEPGERQQSQVVEPGERQRAGVETPADRTTNLLADTPWADQLGARATLLQFSSAFCAPCRTARVVLADVADTTPGVVHLEIDAEQHLDVVRRLGVLRTPTTLVLDAAGREVTRAAGAPRREQVRAALAQLERGNR